MSSGAQNPSVFFVLGATHHEAPIAVREKLAVNGEAINALHAELTRLDGLLEFAVLSTCNRTEFYGVASAPEISAGIQRIFCDRQGFPETEFEGYRMQLHGQPAVQHLLEVAAGLDSQLVGETEIFGQLKEAYALAQNRRSTGPVLNRVFQKAFQAAKHVRTHTAITSGRVSVANVAVDLAQSIFGDLGETRILLLGAGEIGEKTARAFQSREAGSLTVSSRSIEHAMELAKNMDATALPFENREHHLGDFDIVVCSTAAPGLILSLEAVRAAMKRRTARPLFFIDLALPRDVEPAVAELPNVYLYNLDDLAKIAEENRAAREAEIEKCRHMLTARTEALWQQISGHAAPVGGTPDPVRLSGP
jgi:glutamyl-tRNA reductase